MDKNKNVCQLCHTVMPPVAFFSANSLFHGGFSQDFMGNSRNHTVLCLWNITKCYENV